MAEGIFGHMVRQAGLEHCFLVDSAGTHAFVNNPPDILAQAIAAAHGIDISVSRSRQFTRTDLEQFDMILAADKLNLRFIKSIAAGTRTENAALLMNYYPDAEIEEVPDPYGSDIDSFKRAFNLIHNACSGLLGNLRSQPASVHDR